MSQRKSGAKLCRAISHDKTFLHFSKWEKEGIRGFKQGNVWI